MTGILSLRPEDEKSIHPEALKWFSLLRRQIEFEVPLEELNNDDLNTFLSDDEKRQFIKYKDEITRGLATCMDTGDKASPDPLANASSGLQFPRLFSRL